MDARPPRLPVPDEELLRRFGLVRAVGGAAYFVAVAVLFGIFGTEVWPLALGIPVLAVVTTGYFKRSQAYPRASVAVSLVADALVLGGGVAFLGGTGSGLVMLYAIVVVSAGIVLGPAGAYSFTVLTLALGLLQLAVEELGVEPALLHRPDLGERVPVLLISLGGLASVGYLSAVYASRLHELLILAGEEAASARERSRRRRSFTQQASLDVQAPLARVDELAAALGERWDELTDADREELAGRLRTEVTGLDAEVARLTDVGALDPADVKLEPILLHRVVDDCLVALSSRLADHEIDVDVGDVKVVADGRAARRVVIYLLENVADHTPPGTRARVFTVVGAGHSVLVVTDEGPGISPSTAEYLFEPPGESGGLRMGLPLVAELCAAMGAQVRYEPAGSDGGARFLVSFRPAPAAVPSADDADANADDAGVGAADAEEPEGRIP